jgi:hypothetical protein
MTHAELAAGLLDAVLAQDFGATADSRRGGAPLAHFPSIDLAAVVFPPRSRPAWANVLFSRQHPRGVVAAIGAHAGAVTNVHYLADQRDGDGVSIAWLPEADWMNLRWRSLAGAGAPLSFVAPYPASLLKMIVAVGVAMAVDEGLTPWPGAAMERMITVSDNDATTEMVALLHRHGLIEALHRRLHGCGLQTLQLRCTRADGGWTNAAGAGVGMIQMTAWDSARLMWLLDDEAPAPPWLAPGTELISDTSRARLRGWLDAQQLGEILSSTSLTHLPGWVAGIPAERRYGHKTGTTENYASDAGIVRGRAGDPVHYIVAVLTNLGTRYAPHAEAATTWRLPALGAAVDRLVVSLIGQ